MNKKLLCTAVGGALALGAGVASAQFEFNYEAMLFPYVVKDVNRTTVITIMTTADSRASSNQDLHVQYWTKSTTDANTAACKPSSVYLKVTPSDVVTFDTAGILGYPLFGDTTNPAPLGASISYAGPVHGYAFVDDNSNQLAGGYWIELDLANGGAIGDYGIASTSDIGDFDNNGIAKASMLGSGNDTRSNHVSNGNLDTTAAPVNFWPTSVASTVFTVTPMGSAMRDSDNSPTILQVFNATPVQGAYDRNENGVDGTVPVTVRCVGRVTPAQLMPGVVANAAWAAQGGWGYLVNLGNNDNTFSRTGDYDAIVYQVDSSSVGGKFMSNATRIVGDTGQK